MAEAVGTLIFGAVGLGAAAAFTVGATTITLGTIVGTAVLVGGSIGLQMLLAPELPTTETPQQRTPTGSGRLPPPEAGHQALRQSIAPRTVAYGRVRVAGTYVFFEAQDDRSYDVIALHHGRIGGFVAFYLHDDVVSNGTIGTIGGYVSVLIDGRYGGNHVFLNTRLGTTPEQPYGEITGIPTLAPIWTAAHRGDGLASLLMICEPTTDPSEFSVIFPRGKPEPSAVIDATPIYDPTDPTQARNNPATWKVNPNPVVQLLDYLTNDDYGMGLDWDQLVQPVIAQMVGEILLCQGVVLHPNGIGEFKYQSNGTFNLDSDPADVVNAILDSCDGWISENGDGTIAVKVGVYRAPQVTFASKHIRGINLQFDVADEEIVNELAITYTEPAMDYKTAPAEPWRNDEDIAERGRVRSQPFSLPWVQSFSQARRLAKRRDQQNNARLRGTLTTTLFGLRALGERWVRIQAPELPDLADRVIEIRGVTIDLLNAQMTFRFISVDEGTIDDWAPAEEGSPPVIPPKLIGAIPPPPDGGDGFPPLNPAIVQWQVQWAGGSIEAFLASFAFMYFDDPHRSDISYQVQFRVNGSSGAFELEPNRPLSGTPSNPKPPPDNQPPPPIVPADKVGIHALFGRITSGALPGTTYEVQMRTISAGGFPSAWSSSIIFTTAGP